MWELHGVRGGSTPPPIHGNFPARDLTMLVVGCGRTMWADLDRWTKGCTCLRGFHTLAINNAIPFIPWEIQHVASYHATFLPHWLEIRRLMVKVKEPHIQSHKSVGQPADCPGWTWDFDPGGGTSGLFAARIALAMGYRRVVLAGVPLDDQGRWHDPPFFNNEQTETMLSNANYLQRTLWLEWSRARDECFQGRVKSLSGRTKQWLGEPDYEAHQ